jgi:hypothetical protein
LSVHLHLFDEYAKQRPHRSLVVRMGPRQVVGMVVD